MLHRHPFLSLLTLAYLGFVGLVTLTPGNEQPDYAGLAGRILARLERYPDLEPLTSRLSVERIEFLANIGLFVPLGVFLLLLFGTRLVAVRARRRHRADLDDRGRPEARSPAGCPTRATWPPTRSGCSSASSLAIVLTLPGHSAAAAGTRLASPGAPRCSRAAATSPAISPISTRVSGCHWTARQQRSPAASIASRVPSAARATAVKPGWVATDWWWWQLTSTWAPTSAASREPDSVATSIEP